MPSHPSRSRLVRDLLLPLLGWTALVVTAMVVHREWEMASAHPTFTSFGVLWLLGLYAIVHALRRQAQRARERDAYEKSLRKSETRYRRMMDLATDAILIVDVENGLVVEANQMAGALFGLPVEKIVGTRQEAFHPPGAAPTYTAFDQDARLTGGKTTFESTILHGDGHEVAVEINAGVLLLDERKIIQAIYRDISHQKRREQLLIDRQEELHAILENALDAIITIDADGRVAGFNPAAEKLFGYTADEASGRMVADLIIPPEFQERHCQALARMQGLDTRHHPQKRSIEFPGIGKDGQQIDLKLNIVSSFRHGEVRYTAFAHDLTKQKQLLRSLRDTLEVAESANRAKSAFLANMSHEIRTPMNAIIGMTDLVLTTKLSPEEQRYNLEIVRHSSDILLTLINSVLDLSKIEAGRLILESLPFDLCRQIENTCERLAAQAHR
ncbi:MAG: PAS domain S-box protein, partial [Magnetococcales bacterium]|nr:PAS domain S-box protein [Magnetococcales bacterium]